MQFTSSGSKSSRKVYVTNSNNNNFSRDSISDFTQENIDYDIDASASALLINIANKNPNTYMPREDFSALSPEVRRIWSKILPNTKAIILRRRTGSCNNGIKNHSKNVYKL